MGNLSGQSRYLISRCNKREIHINRRNHKTQIDSVILDIVMQDIRERILRQYQNNFFAASSMASFNLAPSPAATRSQISRTTFA